MNESIANALIGSAGAVVGSIITVAFTYRSTRQAQQAESNRLSLLKCWRNIAAFYDLEKRYVEVLKNSDKSAESWRREIRKQQRDDARLNPDVTEADANKQILRFSD